MTQELNPRCIQLDDVVNPETYQALALEGLSIPVTEVAHEDDTNSDPE